HLARQQTRGVERLQVDVLRVAGEREGHVEQRRGEPRDRRRTVGEVRMQATDATGPEDRVPEPAGLEELLDVDGPGPTAPAGAPGLTRGFGDRAQHPDRMTQRQ